MAVFILPKTREHLKYHTRWNDSSMNPYIDDLIDLWAENDISGVVDVCIQGPMMTRIGVRPEDIRSASRIIKLEPLYRSIFRRKDLRVYRSEGHVYIDIPWQRDTVWLGDLLTSPEYESSEGLPLAIGMNLYRECIMAELTYIPNLLVGGTPSSGLSDFLQGLVLSILMRQTPEEVDLYLCASPNLSFEEYTDLPYCHVMSSVRQTMAMLSDMSAEIERRSEILQNTRCRNIFQYNERGGMMRHRIIMITEYQRLFSSNKQAAMAYILRISQLAGPCGIHLILASSKPSCLRGLKESFPARVCLKVASQADSRILLDQKGGETLPRKGSLYYLDGHSPDARLLQGGRVTSREVKSVLDVLRSNYINVRKRSIFDEIEDDEPDDGDRSDGRKSIWTRLHR